MFLSWPVACVVVDQAVPEAALTVDVSGRLLDGALGDEGRVLRVAWNHLGLTLRPLG